MALYFVNEYVTICLHKTELEVGTELKRELDDIENGKRRKNKWTLVLRL